MLNLELNAFESIAGPHYRNYGAIGNIGGARLSHYEIVLDQGDGTLVGQAQLLCYARWSEPVTGLVARCLARALFEPRLARPLFRLATLHIALNSRPLKQLHARIEGGKLDADGYVVEVPASELPPPLWRVVQWSCAMDAWGTVDTPPLSRR